MTHSDQYFKMLHTCNVKYIKILLTDEDYTPLHYLHFCAVYLLKQII